MHRNHRLTEIVRILRASSRTSAEQLAHHFAVSPRTIYRDIALLHRMKVPVVGEAGIGYHIDPRAELDGVQFTADELHALFDAARKNLAAASSREADAILRAMTKVKQVLPEVLLDALLDGPLPLAVATPADHAPALDAAG